MITYAQKETCKIYFSKYLPSTLRMTLEKNKCQENAFLNSKGQSLCRCFSRKICVSLQRTIFSMLFSKLVNREALRNLDFCSLFSLRFSWMDRVFCKNKYIFVLLGLTGIRVLRDVSQDFKHPSFIFSRSLDLAQVFPSTDGNNLIRKLLDISSFN